MDRLVSTLQSSIVHVMVMLVVLGLLLFQLLYISAVYILGPDVTSAFQVLKRSINLSCLLKRFTYLNVLHCRHWLFIAMVLLWCAIE